MTSMKQFGLAALFVIGVALFTSSPAVAEDYGPITLSSTTNVRDQDYGATGQATLTNVYPGDEGWGYLLSSWYYPADHETHYTYVHPVPCYLTVTYQGLTPGATYQIKATHYLTDYMYVFSKKAQPYSYFPFTASTTGAGEVTVQVTYGELWNYVVPEYGIPYWEQISGGRMSLTVERKDGRNKYTTVLGGGWSNLP